MMFGTREWFDYRRCHACGTLQIETVPADLERHYPPTYYSLTSTPLPAGERSAPTWLMRERVRPYLLGGRQGWRRALRAIDRYVAIPPDVTETVLPILARTRLRTFDDPILDVGSGARPARLAAFRRGGFRRLLAIDPFVTTARYQGVPVRRASIGEIEGSWRLVMFHHSFEHVEDPPAELAHTARLLENGGYLLIRMPVMGSGMWDRFGTDWVELDAPRHLFLFTSEGLTDLARRHGFEPVAVESDAGWWDLVASEQYRRDLGMYEPTSWFVDEKTSVFDREELLEFRRQSREMNERGTAGRAAFWFRRVVAPGGPA